MTKLVNIWMIISDVLHISAAAISITNDEYFESAGQGVSFDFYSVGRQIAKSRLQCMAECRQRIECQSVNMRPVAGGTECDFQRRATKSTAHLETSGGNAYYCKTSVCLSQCTYKGIGRRQ